MPRRANPVPTYRLHKPSGQAVATVRTPGGGRHDVYLGPYDSEESRREYARLLAADSPPPATPTGKPAAVAPPTVLTVNEVFVRFLKYADGYYRRPDGTPTTEPRDYRLCSRVVRPLFGSLPAAEFGPRALKTVRQAMIDAKLARTLINQRAGRVVRVFKWAVAEELIPETVYRALTAVPGLQKGRCEAKETEPVKPVEWKLVKATLPHLNPVLKAMVLVQWYSGCRPGEVCQMRAADIDRTGDVWRYCVKKHKTVRSGKARVVALGRKAQAVLGRFLAGADPEEYLFSPVRAVAMRRAERRAKRKTKVQPSQVSRAKASPRKRPGLRYTPRSYHQAIRLACLNAGLAHWHPHQLRHAFATRANRMFGIEEVQTALGHATLSATQVYAERAVDKAVEVAKSIG